VCGTWCTG